MSSGSVRVHGNVNQAFPVLNIEPLGESPLRLLDLQPSDDGKVGIDLDLAGRTIADEDPLPTGFLGVEQRVGLAYLEVVVELLRQELLQQGESPAESDTPVSAPWGGLSINDDV